MAGGKGKSTGGKAGPKEAAGKSQKSHSAKAGLQVRKRIFLVTFWASKDRDGVLGSTGLTARHKDDEDNNVIITTALG